MRLHLPQAKNSAMKMVKPTLTTTITIRYQFPSRSSFLFPRPQSLRCLHTTTARPRTAHQSIATRQPAQASPMLLAKQQYLKTRIKDLGILPGMYSARRKDPGILLYIHLYREKESKNKNKNSAAKAVVYIQQELSSCLLVIRNRLYYASPDGGGDWSFIG